MTFTLPAWVDELPSWVVEFASGLACDALALATGAPWASLYHHHAAWPPWWLWWPVAEFFAFLYELVFDANPEGKVRDLVQRHVGLLLGLLAWLHWVSHLL